MNSLNGRVVALSETALVRYFDINEKRPHLWFSNLAEVQTTRCDKNDGVIESSAKVTTPARLSRHLLQLPPQS